jgi:roadblock/LC7 domain-containing protein
MSKLDELMKLDGALAAFEFASGGELTNSLIAEGANIDNDVLDMVCHVCVANGAIATMQARGWEKMTQMEGFYPIQGFSLIGFEWTVIVTDTTGVIIKNDVVDYDATYKVLEA